MARCQNCGNLVTMGVDHVCTGLLSAFPPNPKPTAATEARAMARVDIGRATSVTPEVEAAVYDMFEYHSWTPEMIQRGLHVRAALEVAALRIIENVPPGPDRSVAIRKLREARMDANSAITHGGKY